MDDQQPCLDNQNVMWNGAGGRGWVALQKLLDQVFQPIEDLLVNGIPSQTTSRALDVGCGTGGTTIAVARRLGPSGSAIGIDISEPMIAAARARGAKEGAVTFIAGDAETYPFKRASFDTLISRFGVMFFSDAVKAFMNLHRAVETRAALRCVVWRSADENPFMTMAERAAASILPGLLPRRPTEPGQFAFADRDRVHGILAASGWSGIDIQPIEVPCAMPENMLVRWLLTLGPVGRLLQEATDEIRARVITAIRPAFEPYVHGVEVRFTAACWLVGARS